MLHRIGGEIVQLLAYIGALVVAAVADDAAVGAAQVEPAIFA
jgi:hypothetical protein